MELQTKKEKKRKKDIEGRERVKQKVKSHRRQETEKRKLRGKEIEL